MLPKCTGMFRTVPSASAFVPENYPGRSGSGRGSVRRMLPVRTGSVSTGKDEKESTVSVSSDHNGRGIPPSAAFYFENFTDR